MKKNKDIRNITIVGAKEHNLKNITVSIPKDMLTVITGPSGSGKSTLALDILYTEGKRRYMESLSSYARQFLGIVKKPDVDYITGLCPSIAIEQKTVGSNPRSTVGTITEIYDYLRVLFARIGIAHCPTCNIPVQAQSPQVITEQIVTMFTDNFVTITAPIASQKKGEFVQELLKHFNAGYYRFIIDGTSYKFTSPDEIKNLKLQKTIKHSIDIILDVVEVNGQEKARIQESVERACALASGNCKIIVGNKQYTYCSERMCVECATSIPELEPRLFSFNSPIGACAQCQGLGVIHEWPWGENDAQSWKSEYPDFFAQRYAQEKKCSSCLGKRLNKMALGVTIANKTIFDLSELPISQLIEFFDTAILSPTQQEIAQSLLKEIISRLQFLANVGLDYLNLNRTARTLSGGEGQRIRLATQIGSALTGVLYVLDEPSIGLHQRDNDRLIDTLKHLRDQGNTVVVVEHDTDTMEQADFIIDMGPGAGVLGGQIIATGSPEELKKDSKSLSGAYLSGKKSIQIPKSYRTPTGYMTLKNARKHNLKDLTVKFPLGVLCGISGVSGSGKSTLIMDELVPALYRELGGYSRKYSKQKNGTDNDLQGAENIQNLVVIDQSPIGRTPRSNPGTYLGIFDDIRKLYASLPESNARGYKIGRFSFNVAEGRCFECSGDGTVTIEMHFLPEVVMICKSCKGKRYNQETLQILYKGKSIADVLDMTAYEAALFFSAHTTIAKRLQLLCEVGLDYLKLGQPSHTLSGGEAQRIKLVDELAKRGNNTMYILDEPTTGLHSHDIDRLLKVLNKLVEKGNSMIVIEHNLDVLKTVDYIIDLGPQGGDKGGTIIASGTPKQVASNKNSHTGNYLKRFF